MHLVDAHTLRYRLCGRARVAREHDDAYAHAFERGHRVARRGFHRVGDAEHRDDTVVDGHEHRRAGRRGQARRVIHAVTRRDAQPLHQSYVADADTPPELL